MSRFRRFFKRAVNPEEFFTDIQREGEGERESLLSPSRRSSAAYGAIYRQFSNIPERRHKITINNYTEKPRTDDLVQYRNDDRQTNPIIQQLYDYMFSKNEYFREILQDFNGKIKNFNENYSSEENYKKLANIATLYIDSTTDKKYFTLTEIAVFLTFVAVYLYKCIDEPDESKSTKYFKFQLYLLFNNICNVFKIHKKIINHFIELIKKVHVSEMKDYFLEYLLILLFLTPINFVYTSQSYLSVNYDYDNIYLLLNEISLLIVLARRFKIKHKFTMELLSRSLNSTQLRIQNGGYINKKLKSKKLKKYK